MRAKKSNALLRVLRISALIVAAVALWPITSIVAIYAICQWLMKAHRKLAGEAATGAWKAKGNAGTASSSKQRAAFDASFQRWIKEAFAHVDDKRWIPSGSASRVITKFLPPVDHTRSWRSITGDPTPLDTLKNAFDAKNENYLSAQKVARREFFQTVEKNPLTDEQIRACICMDDAVMVVAAAGSGKTSTMVAKAGYVLHERLATPHQILLLAFNRAAADELQDRIRERLNSIPNVDQVRADTFHAFGIHVIAKTSGKKPSLAPWVDPSKPGEDIREIGRIIETLKAQDPSFEREWNLFRTIYGRDVVKWGQPQQPDAYRDGKSGFLTANNDIVKSMGERVIADWLFYHGVTYEYERPYEHDTATEQHRQYFPDFYYPAADLYHEHLALNARGEAPKEFRNYLEGVKWKRRLHAEKGTSLLETSSHELMTGEAFSKMEQAITARGISLEYNPDREATGLPPIPEEDLARSFRVFLQHVKNNGLDHDQLHRALKKQAVTGYATRLRMYLAIFERIAVEWEQRLQEGGFIDFEDMLIQAAESIESGDYKSPYSVILADEFQDSSRARIRLLKALAASSKAQTHLCVVGDDWQGINRFAGSDISVMTEFEKTFSHATRLTLNTTFRCPQDICDASSAFIQANPVQIRKLVRTTNKLAKTPLLAFSFPDELAMSAHLQDQLSLMHRAVHEGKLEPLKGDQITVLFLGRYRDDSPPALNRWRTKFGDRLKIDFRTVHGSKGLEAEYVFVLNVIQGTRGFPSQIQDDPALQLAMPTPDFFPFAEERRLFYVAMTRALKQVRFYTMNEKPSQFLIELVEAGRLSIETSGGGRLEVCPKCSIGTLQLRTSRHGAFHGCSRFPACDYARDAAGEDDENTKPSKGTQRIDVPVRAGDQCPVCRLGIIQQKKGRNGPFLGCSRYREGCIATKDI